MRTILATAVAMVSTAASVAGTSPEILSRADLLADTRQLMGTLESVHPDPYLRAGGKIALHRHFQEVLGEIPDAGMTRTDYAHLVAPLLAAVGDGHSFVVDNPTGDPYAPGGIPLYFEVAADCLYVLAVLDETHRELLGARLRAVEGVPVDDLLARQRRLRAADNIHHLRRSLAAQGALWYGDQLRRILPEWRQTDRISIELALAPGPTRRFELAIPASVDYARLILPAPSDPALVVDLMTELERTDITYRFLDADRTTCLLVIKSLEGYREVFEVWHSYGITAREPAARALYTRYNGRPAPEPYSEVLAGLPSATEIFLAMRNDMRRAGTRNLLVDLSQNGGGSSVLGNILVWALYGRQAVLDGARMTTEVVKLSPQYFAQFPSPTLAEINADRPFPLATDDYDLSADRSRVGDRAGRAPAVSALEDLIRRMPTFTGVWGASDADRPDTPANVMVLCDAGTYSAAFTVMFHLRRCGAAVVGAPSAQAGNCFGDVMQLELPRSGVRYQLSRKYFELFPGDPGAGRVLMPDHLLSYETLAGYGFEPLALIRFATEILNRRSSSPG